MAEPVLRKSLGALGALSAGAALAIQVRLNGGLGGALGDGLVTSAVSFAVGTVLVSLIVAVSPRARESLRRIPSLLRTGQLRWWELAGGLSGVVFIFAQGAVGALIGAALFTVGIIAGQSISALLVDRLGLGPTGGIPITVGRVIAAALGLLAGIIAVAGNARIADNAWLIALPFVAGLTVAWQQAVNGKVALLGGEPMGTTWLNFVIGAVILVPVAIGSLAFRPTALVWPTEPWLYAGGAAGVVVVALSAIFVARTGVLLFGLASITGQLATSVLLDILFPTSVAIDAGLIVAVVFAFVAVAVASIVTRPRDPSPAASRPGQLPQHLPQGRQR